MTKVRAYSNARRSILLVAAALMAVGSFGCAPNYKNLKPFIQAHRQDVAGVNYRLEPPDTIIIDSPTSAEIDGEILRIRSDGRISLRLIGEVQISGMTPEEVAVKLEQLLSRYYASPKVTVRVATFESKNIYITGQVMAGGAYPFTGRDTLIDLIATAKPNFLAWGAQVKVIRPSPNPDEIRVITVNVDEMLEKGNLTNNFLLQEGDQVFVPPTPLGWVGLRIQELLFPISPALTTFNTPVQARNTTDQMRYGGYDNSHSNNNNNGAANRLMMLAR